MQEGQSQASGGFTLRSEPPAVQEWQSQTLWLRSSISLLIVSLVKYGWISDLRDSQSTMQLILSLFQVWCILVIIMACTDSKDFGKLFTIKYGTAMFAKVITMMFPIVPWFLDIGVFL